MRAKSIRIWICVLVLSWCLGTSHGQQPHITFEVISQSPLKEGEQIFITGNQPSLGMWNASATTLIRSGDVWRKTLAFPVGTKLEFKLTKGTWDSEAMTREGRSPGNYAFEVRGDTTVAYTIPFWKDSVYNTAPAISGNYQIHEDFPAIGLASRRVIVWLPPSYDSAPQRRYPVLYMHDGQNVFDPYTSTLGYDWRVDEIADSLMKAGEIEEFICVATYCNPGVRAQEYSDDPDLGEKYQDFMCCQLKPWIDSTYRADPRPEHTAIMGASMGGLISFIMAWEYPEVFSMAACMSPAFKVALNGVVTVDYVDNVIRDTDVRDINLYIDNGTVDLEAILQPGIDEMLRALDDKGYQYQWSLDEGAPHNEIAWSARVWRPLLQFFGK
jgi:predicted alpha/beta superfamily hydrolase